MRIDIKTTVIVDVFGRITHTIAVQVPTTESISPVGPWSTIGAIGSRRPISTIGTVVTGDTLNTLWTLRPDRTYRSLCTVGTRRTFGAIYAVCTVNAIRAGRSGFI